MKKILSSILLAMLIYSNCFADVVYTGVTLTGKTTRNLKPTDIPEGVLWLDAADSTTITLNGATVSQWADKSGNANHATQSTDIKQPTYTYAGQNNRNVITFDGTSDEMILPSGVYSIPNGNNTGFVVIKQSIGSTPERIINLSVSGTKYLIQYGSNNFRFYNNLSFDFVAISATTTNYNIVTYSLDLPLQSISVNGGVSNTDLAGVFVPGIDAALIGSSGGGNFLTGNIAEIIIFNRSLTTTERKFIKSYLSYKWNITLS